MATLLTIVPTPRFPSPRALLPRFLALEATVAVLPPQGPRSVSLMNPTGRAGPLGNWCSLFWPLPARTLS